LKLRIVSYLHYHFFERGVYYGTHSAQTGEFRAVDAPAASKNKKNAVGQAEQKNASAELAASPATAGNTPWQFYIVLGAIGAGVLGLILKVLGLF
jgi:hypothetical protein